MQIVYFCKMKGLKKLFRFYVFSNIHVALAGFCLTLLTVFKFNTSSFYYAIFVFFAIMLSYTFIREVEVRLGKIKWYKAWYEENFKKVFFLNAIGGSVLFFLFWFKKIELFSLGILVPFFLVTLFYVIPIYKSCFLEFSFRSFPFIKIYSIALVWGGVTVLFPLSGALVNYVDKWLYFIQVVLFIIAITIPFDIRDVATDEKKIQTIPQLVGVKKAKYIGVFLAILFAVVELFKPEFSLEVPFVGILIITFNLLVSPFKKRLFTSFWVEATPIFWLLMYLFVEYFTKY